MFIHHDASELDLQVTFEVDGARDHYCDVCGDLIPSSTLYARVVALDEPDVQDYWHTGCIDLGYVDG